jgi:hypothetical protein
VSIPFLPHNLSLLIADRFRDSTVLTDSEGQKLRGFCADDKKGDVELKLLYRSRDGFDASDFHRLCDGKRPTLTIVPTPQGSVFVAWWLRL